MNITMVGTFPPFRGGIADLNAALAGHLANRHHVNALNFTTQYPSLLFPGKTQVKERAGALQVSSDRILSSINPFSWRRTAVRIVRQKPDLVIFRNWMPFFAPAFGQVVRMVRIQMHPIILAICDNILPHEQRPLDLRLTRYFLDKVDRFVVMSKSVENDLVSLYPNAKYRFSPHPIYDFFGEEIPKQEARKILGLDEENIVLFFGVIRKYKGLSLLIRAAQQLKKHLKDFRVIAVGECYEGQGTYEKLITDLGVDDVFDLRAFFIPDREVGRYFSAADLVVLPYRSATQSGIVTIAYHFNRPVLVTNVGGLPEMVPHNKLGWVVEPNSDSLARGILDFFQSGSDDSFTRNFAAYKQKFSWDRLIGEIEDLASL